MTSWGLTVGVVATALPHRVAVFNVLSPTASERQAVYKTDLYFIPVCSRIKMSGVSQTLSAGEDSSMSQFCFPGTIVCKGVCDEKGMVAF